MSARHSCIYEGRVVHKRFGPRSHHFSNRLFLMYLDLEELPHLFDSSWSWSTSRPALARYRREDFLGPHDVTLDEAVRNDFEAQLGTRPTGPIRLLTHLRYFGYIFNPVSFYYAFDTSGEQAEAVLAEITNTPWKERQTYAIRLTGKQKSGVSVLEKAFHVSPFMPMDMVYRWQFSQPQELLSVHMENHRDGVHVFTASMQLKRRDLNPESLRTVLWRYPLMTLQVIASIHYQALRLWLKRTPFHPHPSRSQRR